MPLTTKQQRELDRAESARNKAFAKLGKPNTDGAVVDYAVAYATVVALRQIDEPGLMGIRRRKYKTGI